MLWREGQREGSLVVPRPLADSRPGGGVPVRPHHGGDEQRGLGREQERTEVIVPREQYCLSCLHEWRTRGTSGSRQCPSCWGRSIVTEDEVGIASKVGLWLSKIGERNYPQVYTFMEVMKRADGQWERRRAMELMLKSVGQERWSEIAAEMYPLPSEGDEREAGEKRCV